MPNSYTLQSCRCDKGKGFTDDHVPSLRSTGFQRWQVCCSCGAAAMVCQYWTQAVASWNELMKTEGVQA